IFQARDNSRALSLGGNALAAQGGVIYAPAALLAISGNSQVKSALVVNQLQVSGNGGSALLADSAGSGGRASAAGQLLAGDLVVYVDNSAGTFTAQELARVNDAIDAVNLA